MEIVDEPLPRRLPSGIALPAKDVPILLAAIDSGATYLLTGDKDRFGKYYGQVIDGVTVLCQPRILPCADDVSPGTYGVELLKRRQSKLDRRAASIRTKSSLTTSVSGRIVWTFGAGSPT